MKRVKYNLRYIPKPLDTSKVELPIEILALSEELAKNTHEVWAQRRFAEGWKYGPERNDKRKEHPCLVPYEVLPENEKEYDRCTALEAIRFVVGCGYEIHQPAQLE